MPTATREIRLTTVGELQESADRLFRDHYDEVAKRKHLMRLSPDWPTYEALEADGKLLALAAYVDGEIVGYSVTLIGPHLHYRDLVMAQNDVLFIATEHRRGRLGADLIRQTEAAARDAGAGMLLWHAKQGTALEALLPRMGYGVHEVMLGKEL